jgi:hypothetical protein
VLPAAFTAAALALCLRLRTRTAWTVQVSLACAIQCWIASGAAVLMGTFASFYSGF